MYVGDKVPHPFYLGSGYAGNLISDYVDDREGLYLPDSAIAKLPKPEPKREFGFNAAQARVQQEGYQRQHQDRDGSR